MSFLTLDEVADILRVKREAVRRHAKTGVLPATRPGKSWLFNPADVQAYIERGYNRTATETKQEAQE